LASIGASLGCKDWSLRLMTPDPVVRAKFSADWEVYLALPLQAKAIAGSGTAGTALVTALFVVSGILAIAGQLRITAWVRSRWEPGRCLVLGMGLLAAAFLPPMLATDSVAALVLTAILLALGTVVVFPFEMDTIIRLSGNRLVATRYGFYNMIVGVGIMLETCSPERCSTSRATPACLRCRGLAWH
jgi:MFS family permease